MAQQSRNTVKSYFQTGDIPTQQQYVHLIDSFVALTNDVNSGSITLTGSLNVSGNINHEGGTFASPNATITSANLTDITVSGTGSFSKITVGTGATEVSEESGTPIIEVAVVGNISASGIIFSDRNVTNQFDIGVLHSDRALLKILAGHSGNPFLSEGNPSLMSQRGLTVTLNGGTSATSGDEFTSGSFIIENHNDGQLMGFPGVNTTQIFKISNQGNISLVNHITASGNISCSGTVIADNFTSTGGDDQITFTDDLFVNGHITASGNISASGTVIAEHLRSFDDAAIEDQLTAGRVHSIGRIQIDSHITASGNISASGTVIAEHLRSFDDAAVEDQLTAGRVYSVGRIRTDSHITASGKISSSNTIIANVYQLEKLPILTQAGNTVFFGDTGGSSLPLEILNKTKIHGTANITSHITASGNISSSNTVTALKFIQDGADEPNIFSGSLFASGLAARDFSVGTIDGSNNTRDTIIWPATAARQHRIWAENMNLVLDPYNNVTDSHFTIWKDHTSAGTGLAAGTQLFKVDESGNISGSNELVGVTTASLGSLKIDGASVDFTNLPTSDSGLPAGRLYRDGNNVKIAT